MNKQRRNEISAVIRILEAEPSNEQIQECLDKVERLMNEEQDYFDNMPENLQGSLRGSAAEDAVSGMAEAIDSLSDAMESEGEEREDLIDDAVRSLEDAQF